MGLAETMFHYERFMRATAEPPAQADFRELCCELGGQLATVEAGASCLAADDWAPGQALGRQVRQAGGDGVLYPSVRWPDGMAVALFWPDCVSLPVRQARQFRYNWNGTEVDRYFVHGTREWLPKVGALPRTPPEDGRPLDT
ncbi:MAG: hypothetical protein NVSMB18_27540 [Acetobacteraceae bacterium]